MPKVDHHRGRTEPLTSRRRLSARLLIALLLVLAGVLTTVSPAAAAPTRARSSYGRSIEPHARYSPQVKCTPRARPGVADLSRRVLRAYPGTRSLGIVRACSAGGRSEHKEGRAWDWGGLNAARAADRRKVQSFTTWLFATDRYGHRHANARRLGIQYVIWNKRIWGSYNASSGWRTYTGANKHTDHVHISFTWAGANMNTSFWTSRVGNVNWAPVPLPPPPPPVSTSKPRPQPTAPATLYAGPEVITESVKLPAAVSGVTMVGALTAGQPYLIEASGTYTYARNAKADAECSRTASDWTWRRDRSVSRLAPESDHLDLYVDGVDLLAQADNGRECDTTNHVYRWMYTPRRSGRVTFKVWEPTGRSDDSGSLNIKVIKSAPADVPSWKVWGNFATGVTSPGALEAGQTYTATITGVVDAGNGVTSDAECSATIDDPVWRRQREVLNGDDFDVLVDRNDVRWEPVSQQDPDEACDSVTHTYTRTLRPQETRPVNIRVGDPAVSGNTGALQVTVVKVVPVEGPETVTVDSSDADGVTTARSYPAGETVRVRVQGTYEIAPGITADAECSTTETESVLELLAHRADQQHRSGARRPHGGRAAAGLAHGQWQSLRRRRPHLLAAVDTTDLRAHRARGSGRATRRQRGNSDGHRRADRLRETDNVPIALSPSSPTSTRRSLTTPVVSLALLLALGLTGCGSGDENNDAAVPTKSNSPTTRSAVIAGPTVTTPAPEITTPLPTLPPGDPGDGPSVPKDTSNVEEPAGAALTHVPVGALLDAKTVGEVLGGSWTSSAAPADSCAAPRPTRAVGTRSTSLAGARGTVIETVATYNGSAGTTAVSNLAKRLRGCGWTQEAEPPLGEHSAELSRKGSAGVERVVVVESEGVAVTVVGRGPVAANSDDWSAIVDVAIGTSCLAAPDGCH